MDKFLYTRTSISGWVLFVFIFISLWLADTPEFHKIVLFAEKADKQFATILLGGIVGIGTPPMLGFLLERISSVFFTFLSFLQRSFGKKHPLLGQMWHYQCNDNLLTYYLNQLDENTEKPKINSAAFLHIVFYTYADKKLLDWARRRRMHMYASFTSGLAILIALFILYCFRPPTYGFMITSAVLIILLIYHAIRESVFHEKVIDSWAETIGKQIISKKEQNIFNTNNNAL